jgi:hypothetical protein
LRYSPIADSCKLRALVLCCLVLPTETNAAVQILGSIRLNDMVLTEPYPAVRADLMQKALRAFYASAERQQYKPGWSTKAGEAVRRAMNEEHWLIQISYEKRCHAFRNIVKNGVPKALRIWILADRPLHRALCAAVALAPLRSDGKFRIKELATTAEKIASDNAIAARPS